MKKAISVMLNAKELNDLEYLTENLDKAISDIVRIAIKRMAKEERNKESSRYASIPALYVVGATRCSSGKRNEE